MSFRFDAAQMCIDGLKTMTRRIPRPNTYGTWKSSDGTEGVHVPLDHPVPPNWRLIRIQRNGLVLWEVGSSVAIKPGRTAKAIGRVMCTSLAVEHVQDISEEDARREGVVKWSIVASHREQFEKVWRRLQPRGSASWDINPLVVVIGFRPLNDGEK
jgi:hypothetical protein